MCLWYGGAKKIQGFEIGLCVCGMVSNDRRVHARDGRAHGKCSACQSASRSGSILPSITNTPGAPSLTQALTGSRSASVRTVVARAP